MKPHDRVKEALERGERDAQLLDGRDFDANYWRKARRAHAALEQRGQQLEGALRRIKYDAQTLEDAFDIAHEALPSGGTRR
jgi:hypothetical protein